MQKFNEGSMVTVKGQLFVVEEFIPSMTVECTGEFLEPIYYLTDKDGAGQFFREEDIDSYVKSV